MFYKSINMNNINKVIDENVSKLIYSFELKNIKFIDPKKHSLSEMQKHVARDCVHFGVTWHSRIADLFKEPGNKYLDRVVL
mgnify:CR=1 FL=1